MAMQLRVIVLAAALMLVAAAPGAADDPPAADVSPLESAASHGRADAQFDLGWRHVQGQGVPQDFAKARAWFEKAATQGDASAQVNLGAMYALGRGVPQDYVQAYAWLNIAAAAGEDSARELRDLLASKIDAAVLMRAQALSRDYFEKYGKTE